MTFLERLRCLMTFGQGVALKLPEITPDTDPVTLFDTWFNDAKQAGILLHESMSVSTCGTDGQPKSRMVLLKEYDEQGFVFYTNYSSDKSNQLVENSKISLLFHWGVLQRQIRIEGEVEKVSQQQSAKYFHSRDRGSQIGAWASKQSEKITYDKELQDRVDYFLGKYPQGEVPHPSFWGGWQVKPRYIEFWQGRSNRLHDRLCFEKAPETDNWQHFKLHP